MTWLLRGKKRKRFLVLGWDCASPELAFEQFAGDMPVLSGLRRQGTWGQLQSCIPCITIPAWSSMLSSQDPGSLGIYGFRDRADCSYERQAVANSEIVRARRVWDYLSEAGLESCVVGVPQTYPVHPLKGRLVSGFLTPGTSSAFTYPAMFKREVLGVTPDYRFDVREFRTLEKADLLQRIIDMTEVQFKLLKHSIRAAPWDFFMHVNMGVDRIHHGFWRYHDPMHRLHEASFSSAIHDYYAMIDEMAGTLIEMAGDDVTVLVVSDHGVKRMDGGICVNEWLWREGWLSLRSTPPEGQITPFEQLDVDWSRTRAWGTGGYAGRVFLNVAGREPQGIVPQEAYDSTRDELAAALRAIPGPEGQALSTQSFKPEAIYQRVERVAPDLLIYFGDLHWRSVGSLGHGRHFTLDNDTGPDDANHAMEGMFVLYEPGRSGAGKVEGQQLMDITPTILQRMGLKVPAQMQGRVILP